MRDGRALTNAILVDSAWKQLVEGLEHVAIILDESRPIGDVFGRRETVESLVAGRRSCQILSSFPQKRQSPGLIQKAKTDTTGCSHVGGAGQPR